MYVALLNGSDCGNDITIKPLNMKPVLISFNSGMLVFANMFNLVFVPLNGAKKEC